MTIYTTNLKEELLPIEHIKSFILPQYALYGASVTMVKFKDSDKQRAVYKIDNLNKSYCLKKVYYDEPTLLFVYSAMEWLYRNSLEVPKLIPTITNYRYVIHNNMLFILTPWVSGEKCDFDNINHVITSSLTLGKLHSISKNFIPISGSASRIGYTNYSVSVSKHFNQILNSIDDAHRYNDKFSNLFLANIDENLELAKLSLEISSSINYDSLSKSLCHGDYVNKNIIIKADGISIIDFDKCKLDYCSQDISYFLRRLLKRDSTNWDTGLTITILDAYMKNNNLSTSDLKYILSYIAFPQKFWKISRDYYKNIKRCNKNSFITLLEKSISHTSSQLIFVYEMISIFEKKYGVTF